MGGDSRSARPESANAELARRAYELWNAGGVVAQVEHVWAPDVVFHDFPEVPDTGTFRGADAVAARLRDQIEAIGEYKIEVRAIQARGPYVLTTIEVIGQGAASAIAVRDTFQHILRIEGDRVKEIRAYMGTETGLDEFLRLTKTGPTARP